MIYTLIAPKKGNWTVTEVLHCFKFIFLPLKDKAGNDLNFNQIQEAVRKEFLTNLE